MRAIALEKCRSIALEIIKFFRKFSGLPITSRLSTKNNKGRNYLSVFIPDFISRIFSTPSLVRWALYLINSITNPLGYPQSSSFLKHVYNLNLVRLRLKTYDARGFKKFTNPFGYPNKNIFLYVSIPNLCATSAAFGRRVS